MIITDNAEIAEQLRVLRNHGSRHPYHHEILGFNSRLDELQAVVLRAKLKRVDGYNDARRANAHHYNHLLADMDVVTPVEDGKGRHVFHQYTLLLNDRNKVQRYLAEAGVASAIYYPIPLHRQQALREFGENLSLPVAEESANRVLSLPMYPELSPCQRETVARLLAESL